MKKAILTLSLTAVMLTAISVISVSQEKPKPKKDTVNIDTDAKPTFYYAAEEEKKASGSTCFSSEEEEIVTKIDTCPCLLLCCPFRPLWLSKKHFTTKYTKVALS
jgi:hypothetical protein